MKNNSGDYENIEEYSYEQLWEMFFLFAQANFNGDNSCKIDITGLKNRKYFEPEEDSIANIIDPFDIYSNPGDRPFNK